MKALVETIVRGLVDHPDEVQVDEEDRGRYLTVSVRVHEDDRGHVIGRNGSTVSAIRTLANSLAQRNRQDVKIDILD